MPMRMTLTTRRKAVLSSSWFQPIARYSSIEYLYPCGTTPRDPVCRVHGWLPILREDLRTKFKLYSPFAFPRTFLFRSLRVNPVRTNCDVKQVFEKLFNIAIILLPLDIRTDSVEQYTRTFKFEQILRCKLNLCHRDDKRINDPDTDSYHLSTNQS